MGVFLFPVELDYGVMTKAEKDINGKMPALPTDNARPDRSGADFVLAP